MRMGMDMDMDMDMDRGLRGHSFSTWRDSAVGEWRCTHRHDTPSVGTALPEVIPYGRSCLCARRKSRKARHFSAAQRVCSRDKGKEEEEGPGWGAWQGPHA
jgi:hypothetical protein